MAIIAQFDTDPLLIQIKDKHHAWHTFPGGAHNFPSRQFQIGTPGSGREFFQFHKDMMNQFFGWNNIHHAASVGDIAAWTAIPSELKLPETGWPNPGFNGNLADAEARINSNMPPFADDDALGIHVEGTIHNWIHGAVAASSILNLPAPEKTIIAGFHSVQSTYFYKIHGLVQLWWDRFLHPKSHAKEILDQREKAIFKEITDTPHKVHLKEIADTGGGKPFFKEKDKEKDLIDGSGPFHDQGDPELIKSMVERIAHLEREAGVKRSPFIKPLMRPEVGASVTKPEQPQGEQ